MLTLFWSTRSPFVRKALVVAHEAGLAAQLDLHRVVVAPTSPHAQVEAVNPLGQIPALRTAEGLVLYDSPVICEYLATTGAAASLFPPGGAARWVALRQQALGDGLMHVLVTWRAEAARPGPTRSEPHVAALARRFAKVIDALEAEALEAEALAENSLTIGHVSLGCALDYADFRYPDLGWRDGRPAVARWHAGLMARASMQATRHSDTY